MVNVKVNGLNLRFTMGTMMAMASINPNGDTLSPLTGVPEQLHGAHILYGAMAAYDEKQGIAPTYSLDQCKSLIKDFTGKQYVAVINGYNQLINTDNDQDVTVSTENGEEEDKKK